jgi:hypothetical protein
MNIELTNYKSLNCESPAASTSDKYVFVPTMDAVKVLNDAGWGVVDVIETKTRNLRATSKHFVSFEKHDNPSFKDGDYNPRIMITNSSDGTCSFQMHTGVFRLICSNGLIVGNSHRDIAIPHIHTYKEEILEQLDVAALRFNSIGEQISNWQQTELDADQKFNFAKAAAKLRWEDPSDYLTNNILQYRRIDDRHNDLWTVMNRVQENMIKGGVQGDKRKVRAITNIDAVVGVNKGIWDITENIYSELAVA